MHNYRRKLASRRYLKNQRKIIVKSSTHIHLVKWDYREVQEEETITSERLPWLGTDGRGSPEH